MKTEEKAKEYSFNTYDKDLDIITQIESAFKNGYELCKFEWQEKTRWKDFNEKSPKINSNIQVIRNINTYYKIIFTIPIDNESDIKSAELNYTHWREII